MSAPARTTSRTATSGATRQPMSRISDDTIAEVKAATSLYRLIESAGVHLKSAGRGEWTGCCPFHNERTPSFRVYADHYHCYGCHASGDAVTWLTEFGGLTFTDAVQQLADMASIHLEQVELTPEQQARHDHHQAGLDCLQAAHEFFQSQLMSPDPAANAGAVVAVQNLLARGFSKDDAIRHGCGYAPADPTALRRHLIRKGFSVDLMHETGLLNLNKGGGCMWRNRLLWPLTDSLGKTVGFSGRILPPEADQTNSPPKYVNSTNTDWFTKKRTLYRWRATQQEARKAGRLVIAEGYTDVMAFDAAGIPATAVSGSAISPEHVTMIDRALPTVRIVFALDGDTAGQKAAVKAWRTFQAVLDRCDAVVLPDNLDPCDYRQQHGNQALADQITDHAQPLTRVVLQIIANGHDLSIPEGQRAAITACNDLLATAHDPLIATGYANIVASIVGVPVSAVPPVTHRPAPLPTSEVDADPMGDPTPDLTVGSDAVDGAGQDTSGATTPTPTRTVPSDPRALAERDWWAMCLSAGIHPAATGAEREWFTRPGSLALWDAAVTVPDGGADWLDMLDEDTIARLDPIVEQLVQVTVDHDEFANLTRQLSNDVLTARRAMLDQQIAHVLNRGQSAADFSAYSQLVQERAALDQMIGASPAPRPAGTTQHS